MMKIGSKWVIDSVPMQTGKVAIVTGANVGLGFETSLGLVSKGFEVIMACRDVEKGEKSRNRILSKFPDAKLVVLELNLASIKNIRNFIDAFNSKYSKLDLLINNAGLMMPPYFLTEDGFESQLGTNYLGHFVLTGLLLSLLMSTPNSRIVTLGSLAHRWGDIYFDDYNFEKKYDKRKAYGQSKLACLMFAYELNRRLKIAKSSTLSLAAHPGVSMTNLNRFLPAPAIYNALGSLFFQNAASGALPTLRAALDEKVFGGDYFGPDGFKEMKGNPVIVRSNSNSMDQSKAQRLWELSEKLTGIRIIFPSK